MNRDERIAYTQARYQDARWNYMRAENPTPAEESEMHEWYKRWRDEEDSRIAEMKGGMA
jgi:hypothetical protein